MGCMRWVCIMFWVLEFCLRADIRIGGRGGLVFVLLLLHRKRVKLAWRVRCIDVCRVGDTMINSHNWVFPGVKA